LALNFLSFQHFLSLLRRVAHSSQFREFGCQSHQLYFANVEGRELPIHFFAQHERQADRHDFEWFADIRWKKAQPNRFVGRHDRRIGAKPEERGIVVRPDRRRDLISDRDVFRVQQFRGRLQSGRIGFRLLCREAHAVRTQSDRTGSPRHLNSYPDG